MRKTIPGFRNYSIDTKGIVYGPKGALQLLNCGMGYYKVQLWKNYKPFNKRVHRLVAQVFLPGFSKYLQVNHKNSDKLDNRLKNLELCTPIQNIQHAAKAGRHNKNRGAKFLTRVQLNTARNLLKKGHSTSFIAKKLNRSQRCIQYIKQGSRGEKVSKHG